MDKIDPVTQVTNERVVVTVRDGTGVRVITDVVPNRFWTATELTAAVRLAGAFTIVGRYGDFDDSTPLDSPDAWRMIVILSRYA
jgi:threonine dehydrogenase-like Zn-dependent dehydrogenase